MTTKTDITAESIVVTFDGADFIFPARGIFAGVGGGAVVWRTHRGGLYGVRYEAGERGFPSYTGGVKEGTALDVSAETRDAWKAAVAAAIN